MKAQFFGNIFLVMALATASPVEASDPTQTAIDGLVDFCASNHLTPPLLVEMHAFSPATCAAAPFTNAISAVSTNWQSIIANWDYYGTNSEMVILIPHLAGFAGTNAWIGIWSSLMDIYEADASKCPIGFIAEIHSPAGSPLEYFAHKNYTLPVISNLLRRTQALYSSDDLQKVEYFHSIFSGEYRQELEFEENWNRVSFEFANTQLTNTPPN